MKMWRSALLSTVLMTVALTGKAWAQTQTSPVEPSLGVSTISEEAPLRYARPAGSLFALGGAASKKPLTGPLSSIGNELQSHGISFRMPTVEQFFNNVTEGSEPGTTGSGTWIIPTFTFNLQRILGIPNARILIAEEINMLRVGDNANQGSFQFAANSGLEGTAKQNIKEGSSLRQFSYEQLLFNRRVDIEVGRLNLKRYFFSANCSIDSLTCLNILVSRNAGLPPTAFSTWTGRAAVNITQQVYVQAGVQEINSKVNNTLGWAWGLNDSTGEYIAGEVAYKSEFESTPYPGEYELGGFHTTSTHADPDNAKITRHGTSAVLLWANQTVWRQDGGSTHRPNNRHVNVFLQAGKSTDDNSVYSSQLSVGANLFAPFKSRPFDIIGVKVTNLQLTYDEQQFLAAQRKASGGPNTFPGSSWYLELNNHFQLSKYGALETFAQYVINPDTVFNAKVQTAHTGWVLGFSFIFDPARLLGLGG